MLFWDHLEGIETLFLDGLLYSENKNSLVDKNQN